MSRASLLGDPLRGRPRNAWRIEVRGAVTKALKETLERRIRRAIGQGANVLILQLECGGGDPVAAGDLARFLRDLKDDKGEVPVRTIAYVPGRAPDTAAFLALGCREIVLGRDGQLGEFEPFLQKRAQYAESIYASLEELARDRHYPPLLARALVDSSATIHLAHTKKGSFERRMLGDEELRADQAGPQKWEVEKTLAGGPEGKPFKLDAATAKELDVAQYVVDSPEDLYRAYGLKNVKEAGPDLLDGFASFLRNRLMAILLIMIGVACLIMELKMPGVTLPGVIAALCFVLYFWAHSQLAGQITMLAVLLFLLGLILIALEAFVLPGFGVTGISGILLAIVSLALVTLEKKPETTHEWLSFGTTLSSLGLGLLGAVVGALVLASYLPHIPYANRLVLKPPTDEDSPDGDAASNGRGSALHPEAAALLGAIGVAVTDLRPAGMARIGDDFVDVVSEGSYVSAGTRLQVIEIEGNRIVVKEV
jgi:membrane-bound ClpP family serine protease